jgi:hypothetical protein
LNLITTSNWALNLITTSNTALNLITTSNTALNLITTSNWALNLITSVYICTALCSCRRAKCFGFQKVWDFGNSDKGYTTCTVKNAHFKELRTVQVYFITAIK